MKRFKGMGDEKSSSTHPNVDGESFERFYAENFVPGKRKDKKASDAELPPPATIVLDADPLNSDLMDCESAPPKGSSNLQSVSTGNGSEPNLTVHDKSTGSCETGYVNNTQTDNTKNNIQSRTYNDLNVRYPVGHKGKFLVLVDTSARKADGEKVFNQLYLHDIFRSKNVKIAENRGVTEQIGRTLFRMHFNTASDANHFVSLDLSEYKLRQFIPDTFVYTFGVMHNVPLHWTDEFIMSRLEPEGKRDIAYVKRLISRSSGEEIGTKTQSVKVAFKTDDIITKVVVDKARMTVRHYRQRLRQCMNCGRIGHTKNSCRSKVRCLNCGIFENCDGNCQPKCVLCGSTSHSAKNRKLCPKWAEEENISETMTLRRISRKEVLESYSTNNRFDIFNQFDEAFPCLPNQNPIPSLSRVQEANRIMTQRRFNKVVYSKPPPPRPEPPIYYAQPVNTDPITPVIYRDNDKVTEFERLLSQLSNFVRSYFAPTADNGAVLRTFEDLIGKTLNTFMTMASPSMGDSVNSLNRR